MYVCSHDATADDSVLGETHRMPHVSPAPTWRVLLREHRCHDELRAATATSGARNKCPPSGQRPTRPLFQGVVVRAFIEHFHPPRAPAPGRLLGHARDECESKAA